MRKPDLSHRPGAIADRSRHRRQIEKRHLKCPERRVVSLEVHPLGKFRISRRFGLHIQMIGANAVRRHGKRAARQLDAGVLEFRFAELPDDVRPQHDGNLRLRKRRVHHRIHQDRAIRRQLVVNSLGLQAVLQSLHLGRVKLDTGVTFEVNRRHFLHPAIGLGFLAHILQALQSCEEHCFVAPASR